MANTWKHKLQHTRPLATARLYNNTFEHSFLTIMDKWTNTCMRQHHLPVSFAVTSLFDKQRTCMHACGKKRCLPGAFASTCGRSAVLKAGTCGHIIADE